ncbi:MAG: type I-E CRISPR-associated protein Cse1/CasA [Rubrivivax sp.]|nr:type I-E CRISPR-associated protein Cse1/CasA [Rubrivivax sp.]
MNLLHDPWMAVRDGAGTRHWITPEQLSDPRWLAFDADRPDFNGALAQFAIGLLQTTTPVTSAIEWRRGLNTPPDAGTLRAWFAPVSDAFALDGAGARFMQDADLGAQGVAVNDIGALLIEAPGEQTLKNNADLFVKRGQVSGMCPACAATALFTLQTNAPSGGAGHRTGLRGGGPLTTLVLAPEPATLWQQLWVNVAPRPAFLDQGGDKTLGDAQRSIPWLGAIERLQAPSAQGQLAQAQVHPAHLYWAMPRRIRLHTDRLATGRCDVCGRGDQDLITAYATKNYGLNYKGEWSHPLSPYYQTKEGWLPLHPQPDGLGYRHWMAWVLGSASQQRQVRVARVVDRALALPPQTLPGPLRLWAFGYDMDNMKARCWYEATLPLYGLADCSADARRAVQSEVGLWLAGAELAASYLRDAVKDAWFDAGARRDFGHVDATFWGSTEPAFYEQLRALIEAARQDIEAPPLPTREAWNRVLVQTATRLFDQTFVGTGPIERQNPRRSAQAYDQLRKRLHGPKLRDALGLPNPTPTPKATRAARRSKETA